MSKEFLIVLGIGLIGFIVSGMLGVMWLSSFFPVAIFGGGLVFFLAFLIYLIINWG